MLFDLRSRGRRRTVQVVYLGLACSWAAAWSCSASAPAAGMAACSTRSPATAPTTSPGRSAPQEKSALKQTKANPNSAAAWGNLEDARYENASSSGYDQATSTYTAAGKKELAGVTAAWQRYSALTKNPTSNLAILAANAYGTLGQYAQRSQRLGDRDRGRAHRGQGL